MLAPLCTWFHLHLCTPVEGARRCSPTRHEPGGTICWAHAIGMLSSTARKAFENLDMRNRDQKMRALTDTAHTMDLGDLGERRGLPTPSPGNAIP